MKVVIVGAGFTGVQLASALSARGTEVVLVENDPERARVAREQVDCAVVEADGNSPATLETAGLGSAAALVALTEDDEVNLITCALADARWPDVRKIARVRNYDYYERTAAAGAAAARPVFGVDRMLNPDVEAAEAIVRAAEHGAVGNVVALDGGRGILELEVAPGCALAGVPLRDLAARTGRRLLVAFAEKPAGAVLPDGSTVLGPGDRIGVVAAPDDLAALAELAGAEPADEPPRRVAVFGAGLIGRFAAEKLLGRTRGAGGLVAGLFGAARRRRREVSLVDPDPELCREAARLLPDARTLCGDIADETFVADERLDSVDLAVLASPNLDANLVMAAYLKSRGARRTVALTAGASLDGIARKLGVDVAVPMRDTVVDALAGHLRGRNVSAVHSVCNRSFEIVECGIEPGSRAAGRALRDLSIPGEYLLLLAAPPGGVFEVPGGDTVLPAGGRAVLVMRAGSRRVPRLFEAAP